MASGSKNKSTGSSTRANATTKTGTQSRTRTNSTQTRRRKQAVNDQMMDDIIMIIFGAVCIFLFLCNFGIIGSFGDVYLGRVNKILPNIKAYFVQISGKEEVFLPFEEVSETLKMGDAILIQIKKEASKGKQALATTKLSLAGMYCVVNNEKHSIEISKKLNTEQRNYWKQTMQHTLESDSYLPKEILSKYCLILRTNVAENVQVSDVINEWLMLSEQMEYILEKGKYQSLYSRVYREKSAYVQHVLNSSKSDLEEIITDDIEVYNELKAVFTKSDNMQSKIRLYQDDFALSKLYSLETKMSEALSKKVWLKSGGFLVIEPTEALTVIDVNSGKFDKKLASEEYYKKVNKEAAVEIAKQLKLRNVSGIIIVDFINMSHKEHQKELLEFLSKLVSKDKIKTYVIGMTSLGLVEITREKKEKPLWEQVQ